MKLPGIEYKYGVQSLGRESVAAVLDASRAKRDAVMAAFDTTAGVIQEQVNEYNRRQNEIGLETATLAMEEADSAFTEKYGSKALLTPDEIPEDIDVKRTITKFEDNGHPYEENRKTIPAYEVRADIYKKHMSKAIMEHAQHIPDPELRRKWTAQFNIGLEKEYGRRVAQGLAEQKVVVQDQRTARFKLAMEMQKWDSARDVVNNMEITPEEKGVYEQEIDVAEETSFYEMAHANLDVDAMLNHIEFLLDPDYRARGGNLNDDQRNTYVTHLRQGIAAAKTGNEAAEKAQKSMLRARMDRVHDAYNAGEFVSPSILNGLFAEAAPHPEMAGKVYQMQLDYEAATIYREQFADVSFDNQYAGLNDLRTATKGDGGAEAVIRYGALSRAVQRSHDEYDKDAVNWASKYWGQNTPPVTPQNVMETGAARIALTESLRSTHGYINSVLSQSEKAGFIAAVRNNGTAANLQLAASITKGFGPLALSVMEDIGLEGAGKNFIVAGEAIFDGKTQVANLILSGADMIKNDPHYLKGVSTDVERAASDAIGNGFLANQDRRGAYQQALINTYVALSKDAGVEPGIYKKDIMQHAFDLVLGDKLHKYKDTVIELPRGMNGEGFNNWMQKTHWSYVTQNWKPTNGMTDRQFQTALFEGDLRLVSVGDNKYFVIDRDGRAVGDRNTPNPKVAGEYMPLVYRIDPQAISREEYNALNGKAKQSLQSIIRSKFKSQESIERAKTLGLF